MSDSIIQDELYADLNAACYNEHIPGMIGFFTV